jgi:hypothetical protein
MARGSEWVGASGLPGAVQGGVRRTVGSVTELLTQIASLLEHYGLPEQAAYARNLAAWSEVDRVKFEREVRGPNIWGGAGSLSDTGPQFGHGGPENDVTNDEILYRELLIRLAEDLETQGLGTDQARERAATFREWNATGR